MCLNSTALYSFDIYYMYLYVQLYMYTELFIIVYHCCYVHAPHAEKNGLSFIETSALDSTNVETAFQNILTGKIVGCDVHVTSLSSLINCVHFSQMFV